MPDTLAPSLARRGVSTDGFVPARRIPVRFAGDGAGVEELSWGQREIWLTMLRQRSWLPIGGWTPLAPGTTLADVAEDLRWIMQRYQPMRTRLRFAHDGRPLQALAARGTIGLAVYECPDGADPEAFVIALDAHDRAAPLDFVEDWPVRMGVVVHRGAPTHLSTVMTHLVTDGLGGRLYLREVAQRRAGAPAPPPIAGQPPLEQARWQGSPAGLRQSAAALRHWEKALRRLPPAAPPLRHEGARFHRGELRSPALRLATQVIAEKADIDSSQVLMTLFALALGGTAILRPMVSNRFRSGLADVVGMVAQRGILTADVAGVPFAEALRRVGTAAIAAYKYAYCDPDGIAALTARVAAEDGADPEAGLWFNDRRAVTLRGFSGALPTADQLRAAPAGAFRWTVAQDDPFDPLSVDIDDVGDDVGSDFAAFLLSVFTDAERFAPASAEALVRSAEALAVQLALLELLEGGG